MSNVYSARLCSGVGLGPFVVVGTVPAGVVWVIRHMTATYQSSPDLPLTGFTVGLEGLPDLWHVGPRGVVELFSYHWSGRHVAHSGEQIYFDAPLDSDWSLLVSGYSLVTP